MSILLCLTRDIKHFSRSICLQRRPRWKSFNAGVSVRLRVSFFSSFSGQDACAGSSVHPVQNNDFESGFFSELKQVISLLGGKGASFDTVTGKYFCLRRKILRLDDNDVDTDDMIAMFDEDVSLFLLKNSTYFLDPSINQLTKVQTPRLFEDPIDFDSESEIKEYAVKLELFKSVNGLNALWKTLLQKHALKPLVSFVSNLILILAIKSLKFEEIQLLLNADGNPEPLMLPTHYEHSENFVVFKQWMDEYNLMERFDIRRFSFLVFDVLFSKFFSIGEKRSILIPYIHILKDFLLLNGPPKCEQPTRRMFRLILGCLTNNNILSPQTNGISGAPYLSIAGIISGNSTMVTAQNRYSFIYQNLFEPNGDFDKGGLIDGRSIALLCKWIVENFIHDPRTLSASLEQVYYLYMRSVERSHVNQPHLVDHAELSFLLFLCKTFVNQKYFSEAYHVLRLSIPKISSIFDRHLSKNSCSPLIKEYLDIMTRVILILSTIFDNVSREGLLRVSHSHVNNSNRSPPNKNTAPGPRLFSFERFDPNIPMRGSTFLSLLFSDMNDFSTMLFKLESLHPGVYACISGVEDLLCAKMRLYIAIFPSLLNFSYNCALSFLTSLKDEEHFFTKIKTSNIDLPYRPTVHSLNFILGIASLPKSIGSANMKDLVFTHIFKETNPPSISNCSSSRPHVYRLFDVINSLLSPRSSFSKKVVASLLEYQIMPNLYTICYFCRGSFALLINSWISNKDLEQSTSYVTSFICRLIERPEILGYMAPDYPLNTFTLPIEYEVVEFPFLSLASQFLFLFRGHSFYAKALNIYCSILGRALTCPLPWDEHYDFRYNFVVLYYSFLSQWEVLPNNTPIATLVPLIWSKITEFVSQSATPIFPVCPEIFSHKDANYQADGCENRIIEQVSKSISEYIKTVSISDVRSWIFELQVGGVTTVGEMRNIPKSAMLASFANVPPEACYLILNFCVKPTSSVEQIPFNTSKKLYAHYCPVLNTKSGRYILTSQFAST
ncbi:hypothetical protein MDAP_002494 [Mitosporidium daphniae]